MNTKKVFKASGRRKTAVGDQVFMTLHNPYVLRRQAPPKIKWDMDD